MNGFNMNELITRLIKYLLEGLAVAASMILILRKTPMLEEIMTIALIAATVFAILDMLSPSVGLTTRQGAGFGLGASMVGWPMRV